MSRLCVICGSPRELARIRWCAQCTRKLHGAICSQSWGHPGDCDPSPDITGWGQP